MSELKLVKKLAEVMDQVKYIQKKGFNKFHNYSYATEADVNEKIREELSKRNVVMIPDVKSCSYREHTNRKNQIEYITTVQMEFTFIDGETGEEIKLSSFGEGQDAGDKGVYKAITGAQKYALMKAFMIPTGDDPESDDGVDRRNAEEKQTNPNEIKPDTLGAIKIEWAKIGYKPAALKAQIKKLHNKSLTGLTEVEGQNFLKKLKESEPVAE